MAFTQKLRVGFKILIFLQEGLYKPLKQPNELFPNQKVQNLKLLLCFIKAKIKILS